MKVRTLPAVRSLRFGAITACALLGAVALSKAVSRPSLESIRQTPQAIPRTPLPDDGLPLPGKTAQRWAIIVGVNDYEGTIRQLHQAIGDAEKLRSTLLDPNVGKFDPNHVRFFSSGATEPTGKATKANIERALREVAAAAGPDDTIWFYFAGHGQYHDGVSYLLPMDFQLGKWEQTGISTRLVRDLLTPGATDRSASGAAKVRKLKRGVVVIDACQSGALARDVAVPENVWTSRGVVAIAAAAPDQAAYEIPRPAGGIFTHVLIRGLNGEADQNKDKVVTAGEMQTFLVKRVEDMARKSNARQVPQFFCPEPALPLTTAYEPSLQQLPPMDQQAPIVPKVPLGPGLLLAVDETRVVTGSANARKSNLLIGMLRVALRDKNVAVLDQMAAQQLRQSLGEGTPADLEGVEQKAGTQASAMGARFLLAGTAEIGTNTIETLLGPKSIASITVTLRLVNEAGEVLFADTFATPERAAVSGPTEAAAVTKGCRQLLVPMVEKVLPAIQAALKPKGQTP